MQAVPWPSAHPLHAESSSLNSWHLQVGKLLVVSIDNELDGPTGLTQDKTASCVSA